jgi:CBS domain containing-hemolysin-like protein
MEAGVALLAVFALVAANGFFVATEFALVSVRRTRIEQLAAEGSPQAGSVLDALNHLDAYIAATQLGITMASLALGWIGEPAFEHLLSPLVQAIPFLSPEARDVASHTVSAVAAFVIITMLHIVFGELAPKSLALQRAEGTALFVARPIHLFLALFRLPITVLNNIGNAVVKVFGIHPAAGHNLVQSAEELKLSIAASREAGLVHADAQTMVDRALDFTKLAAHHVMVPRTEMIAIPDGVTLDRLMELVELHQHSRYPVYHHTTDDIVGILSVKRLFHRLPAIIQGQAAFDLREHLAPPVFLPESMPTYQVLAELKRQRTHVAILVDEYGSSAGLMTLRDLMERIAGEVPDETETTVPEIEMLPDASARVDGLTLLSDVEAVLGIPFADADYDTLGGFMFGQLGRRPRVGDTVRVAEHTLTVEEVDGLRVARVHIRYSLDAPVESPGSFPIPAQADRPPARDE